MADDIATIAGGLKPKLSEFDQLYQKALYQIYKNENDGETAKSVQDAQQKVNGIWGDFKKLQLRRYLDLSGQQK